MATVGNTLFGNGAGTPINPTTLSAPIGTATIGGPQSPTLTNVASGLSGINGETIGSYVSSVLFSSRVIAIVLGFIFIAGAILLYIGEDLSGAIEAGKSGVARGAELLA